MRNTFLSNIYKEFKREFNQVSDERTPGFILKILRYIFTSFYLLSPNKWISGTTEAEIKRIQGNLRRYRCIDKYVTLWVIAEFIGIFYFTSKEPIASKVIIGIIFFFGCYRLFDIFQAWVNQFILRSKWEAIDVNRSLLLNIIAYVEITIIGAILSFVSHQSNEFSDAFYHSAMNMIANPQRSAGSAILYTQIMFPMLFVAVVVQHIVGRISTKWRSMRNLIYCRVSAEKPEKGRPQFSDTAKPC